ncbi:MarR family winged helix-turn-helix transcriptional regulator [Streptomyces sp. NPDC050439]|uniref:MarR family winged helix-turn-helix transcriptional regulator n=1 Tax=unclassified Streptomyces TaxID=2593676 RepID=UPI00342BB9AF
MTTTAPTTTATTAPIPASAPAPTANGRVVALAHYASRALLERVLTRNGTTFPQNVTLQVLATAGEPMSQDELVGNVTGSLKVDDSVVHGVIEELTSTELLEKDPADASRIRLTGAGRELHATTSAEAAQIAARLYTGIPAEDLAVAGRVLTLVTERANAELAEA